VRVHWTPYWRVTRGLGCVARHNGWTLLTAPRPGVYLLTAHFSLWRFLEHLPRCAASPAAAA
jgi:hypothetical protein